MLQLLKKSHFRKLRHVLVVRKHFENGNSFFAARGHKRFSVVVLAHRFDQPQAFTPKCLLFVVRTLAYRLLDEINNLGGLRTARVAVRRNNRLRQLFDQCVLRWRKKTHTGFRFTLARRRCTSRGRRRIARRRLQIFRRRSSQRQNRRAQSRRRSFQPLPPVLFQINRIILGHFVPPRSGRSRRARPHRCFFDSLLSYFVTSLFVFKLTARSSPTDPPSNRTTASTTP